MSVFLIGEAGEGAFSLRCAEPCGTAPFFRRAFSRSTALRFRRSGLSCGVFAFCGGLRGRGGFSEGGKRICPFFLKKERKNMAVNREKEPESLSGTVEEVIYHNNENDYTVLSVISSEGKLCTAVGRMAFAAEGEEVVLYGGWVRHAEYGEQFAFEQYERELPEGKGAILRYLSAGVIKGIGPATASRLVSRYGEDTFEVIEHHPEWLSEIPGISSAKAAAIHRSFTEQTGIRSLMMLCRSFFSTAAVGRIYKLYGTESVEKVKENPYALCGVVPGIRFEATDRLAEALDFAKDAPERICGGISYILEYNAQTNGHTALPREKLVSAVAVHLGVPAETVRGQVERQVAEEKLLLCADGENAYIAAPLYGEAEKTIAARLALLEKTCVVFADTDIALFIRRMEEEQGITYATGQKQAIKAALECGVMVLTGGPGTGKTTVVRALLRIFEFVGLSVELLAPTGRAANRMAEATVHEAKTIHRALEMERGEDALPVYRRCESDPLDAKAVIVDEASMIDACLMGALLRALKRGTRLILIGDVDQLPSVGAGNVLGDIIASGRFRTVRLEEIFRQSGESLIVTNAHRINRGEMPVMDSKDRDFFFLPCPVSQIPAVIADLICRRLPKAYGEDFAAGIQVITPARKGVAGAEQLNLFLQAAENPPDKAKKELRLYGKIFREGDRVMQVRNNYDLTFTRGKQEGSGIFNGETGFLSALDGEEVTVFYDDRETKYDKDALEDLDHAYAITIHKSQGSEYPTVIMPLYDCPPLLATRHLFYTAVTRARRMVILVGSREAACRMVNNDRQVMRYTTLCRRLTADEKKA